MNEKTFKDGSPINLNTIHSKDITKLEEIELMRAQAQMLQITGSSILGDRNAAEAALGVIASERTRRANEQSNQNFLRSLSIAERNEAAAIKQQKAADDLARITKWTNIVICIFSVVSALGTVVQAWVAMHRNAK